MVKPHVLKPNFANYRDKAISGCSEQGISKSVNNYR